LICRLRRQNDPVRPQQMTTVLLGQSIGFIRRNKNVLFEVALQQFLQASLLRRCFTHGIVMNVEMVEPVVINEATKRFAGLQLSDEFHPFQPMLFE